MIAYGKILLYLMFFHTFLIVLFCDFKWKFKFTITNIASSVTLASSCDSYSKTIFIISLFMNADSFSWVLNESSTISFVVSISPSCTRSFMSQVDQLFTLSHWCQKMHQQCSQFSPPFQLILFKVFQSIDHSIQFDFEYYKPNYPNLVTWDVLL